MWFLFTAPPVCHQYMHCLTNVLYFSFISITHLKGYVNHFTGFFKNFYYHSNGQLLCAVSRIITVPSTPKSEKNAGIKKP